MAEVKFGYENLRRKNAKGVSPVGKGFANLKYREGRTYEDFESRMKYSAISVVEMDTVKGVRERGKRLLTMIFRDNSIMLMFLLNTTETNALKSLYLCYNSNCFLWGV